MKDVNGAFAHLLGAAPRACRVCGCTETNACLHPDGRPCAWVGPNLCSVCANTVAEVMLALDVTDREAEAFLVVLVRYEASRRGMSAPEFRRQANARAAGVEPSKPWPRH